MDSTKTANSSEELPNGDVEKSGFATDVEKGGITATTRPSLGHHDPSDEKPDGPDAGKGHPELVDWEGEDDPEDPSSHGYGGAVGCG